MEEYHRGSNETISVINSAYDKAIRDINNDINKIFYTYQLGAELSPSEARGLLNSIIPKKELASIRNRIHGIEDKDLKKYMMAQLNSGAYKARITRLEALKESIYINTKLVADTELNKSTKLYTDNINKAYYTNSFDIQKGLGIGFNVAQMPIGTIQEILNNDWSGKHFSKRIWKNTDVLAEKLEEVVTSGLMTGKSSRRMATELNDLTDYGKFASERLIRTETTYITNMADIESYKECSIDKYIFVATLDIRTSEQCRKMDRKVIEVDNVKVGINLPPLHPYCRSTTRAYLGESTLKDINRRARDPETGKTYLVPADMNYQDWYDKFVVGKYGKDKTDIFEKIVKNKASDSKQFNKYKEVLGKNSSNTLKDFKELKYNDSNRYTLISLDYRRRTKLIDNPELKLPNAESSTIAESKFTKYLFDGDNEKGKNKGRLITKRLGYDISNYTQFEKEIKERSIFNPTNHKTTDQYGDKYEQKMVMYGVVNNPTNVVVGWNVKGDKTHLTSVYIKEVKKGED